MARHGTTHWDVAAYALGVLDPADAARCEAHLARCPSCAAELDALLPTTKLLGDVDAEVLREVPPPSSVDRLLVAVREQRQRQRLRRHALAATGTGVAAVLAGIALFAGATWLAPGTDGPLVTAASTPSASPGTPGSPSPTPSPLPVELVSVTDPETGVRAEVSLRATEWGTLVSVELSAVAGPRAECRLVLVHADGATEVAGRWRVPEEGYGTPAWPDPLTVPATTLLDPADLAELRIVALDPDGTEHRLVTVPL